MRFLLRLLTCIFTGCVVSSSFAANLAGPSNLRSIGVTVSDLGNPFFVRIAETVREELRERLGDRVAITIQSNAYDQSRLEQQIHHFIDAQVDLIILVAAHPEAIEPSIRQAQRTGIKVVAVDVNAAGADATVTTDNVQAGEAACEFLAKQLQGKGEVAIINGPQVSSVVERVAGCKSVLNNYPEIYLLSDSINGGGSEEGGIHSMASLIETYPELDAVFAINDPTASGAAAIARRSGMSHLIIVSVDGAPIAVENFKHEPKIWLASAAQLPAVMAATAVDIGIKLVAGVEVEQTKVLIPTQLIQYNNVHLYQGWE